MKSQPLVIDSAQIAATGSLVSVFKSLLVRGDTDLDAFLAEHPECVGDKDVAIDLAYEDFCHRAERGEKPDPMAYLARFPQYRTTLAKLLVTQKFLGQNPHLVTPKEPCPWPQPGTIVSDFTVVRELGRGSFARVYLAQERPLGGRLVAIKVSEALGAGEAEILGQLDHDHIVAVHSVRRDTVSGRTIVCMPYFGRATLCDVLDRIHAQPGMPRRGRIILDAVQPRPGEEPAASSVNPSKHLRSGGFVEAVVEIGIQLADALAFVHARRIYHRDLKPSNVLLGPDGRARLLDFNLSFYEKLQKQPLGGTLPYMPPEQLLVTRKNYDGPPVLLDGRSDLYSLGVMLYELLAKAHPAGPIPWKESEEELRQYLIERVKQAPENLTLRHPQVDDRLAAIIQKCLAPKQDDRFASASELAEALRDWLSPVRRARRWIRGHSRPLLVAAATLAAALLIPFGTYYLVREPYPERQVKQALEAYREARFVEANELLCQAAGHKDASSRVYFFRGLTYLQLREWAAAESDFRKIDDGHDGRVKACLAYCLTETSERRRYDLALDLYTKAIEAGCTRAAVYNNMGYCCFRDPHYLNQGIGYLEKAIELDPKLQVAYYNLALLELNKTVMSMRAKDAPPTYFPRKGIEAVEKALELGPACGAMYRDAACLYSLAAMVAPDKGWKQKALRYAALAVEHGVAPNSLRANGALLALRLEPNFQHALTLPARVVPMQVQHCIPPVVDPI